MALKLITAATVPAVSLAEAKLACRFDPTELDADITAMLLDAQRLVEHEVGVCLTPQTWEVALDAFPAAVELTRLPVASITSITYADATGAQQTLSAAAYALDGGDGHGFAYAVPVYGASWPETRDEINAVKVRYVAGYADAASVPSHLKRAVKIEVARMIKDPEAGSERLMAISKIYSV